MITPAALLSSLLLLLSAASCATRAPVEAPSDHLLTVPIDSRPVFLGVAPPLSDPEAAKEALRTSAALQAARWMRLSGEALYYARQSGGESIRIDRWIDEAGNLYTLAVCPKPGTIG